VVGIPAIRPATRDPRQSTATSAALGSRVLPVAVSHRTLVYLSYSVYGWAAFFLVLAALGPRVATGTSPSLTPHLPELEPALPGTAALAANPLTTGPSMIRGL
jgi:hypothetical protein